MGVRELDFPYVTNPKTKALLHPPSSLFLVLLGLDFPVPRGPDVQVSQWAKEGRLGHVRHEREVRDWDPSYLFLYTNLFTEDGVKTGT